MAIVQVLARVPHVALALAMKHAVLLRVMVQVPRVQVLLAALVVAMRHAVLLRAMVQALRVQVLHVVVLRVQVQVLHVLAQVLNAAQPAVRHKVAVTAILMATSGKKFGHENCLCPDSY